MKEITVFEYMGNKLIVLDSIYKPNPSGKINVPDFASGPTIFDIVDIEDVYTLTDGMFKRIITLTIDES